ncbi:hypothetical protein [Amycolatopsis anabasis]|uniref:hypothetical protein n=1 Tax=Amycolatopsis anabasis TaxID=1840409 RepID=UPI00131E04BE|nr:hypothetical protein [Amycolatopsis anabasis]
MRGTVARWSGLAGTLFLIGLGGGIAPAQAGTPAGTANLGSADFTKSGTTSTIPVLAECAVEGPTSASSAPVSRPGVRFGSGTSACTTTVTDPANDVTTTTSKATGSDFELSALVSVGGPRIRIRNYEVTCTGTQSQTSANWHFSGLSGITGLPSPMPVNYTKPITKSNGTVLANAVFNIQTLPGDGSIALTTLRIDFLPASTITGSVRLGHAACGPTP